MPLAQAALRPRPAPLRGWALAVVAVAQLLGACGGESGDSGESGTGTSGTRGDGATASGAGATGAASSGSGATACLPFGDSCGGLTDTCCDVGEAAGACFVFGMGARCTIECPAAPDTCPNDGLGCNSQTPSYCKAK